jgi:hypothetical protein
MRTVRFDLSPQLTKGPTALLTNVDAPSGTATSAYATPTDSPNGCPPAAKLIAARPHL